MHYISHISKLNKKLSIQESIRILQPSTYQVTQNDYVLQQNIDTKKLEKLAFTKKVYKIICTEKNYDELQKKLRTKNYTKKSFKINPLQCNNKQEAITKIANIIGKHKKVNLTNPEEEYAILEHDKHIHVAKHIWTNTDNFYARNPINRPILHPTSLKPRFAKAMINLANPKKEVLDPFCGSGGILIESSLQGLQTTGYDFETKMIRAAKKNLKHYNLNAKLIHKDGLQPLKKVECIVTDIPYGKNSKIQTTTKEFLLTFLTNYHPYTNTIVVCHPKKTVLPKTKWNTKTQIHQYLNKSLSRTISVLEK